MAKQLDWNEMESFQTSERVPFFNLADDGDKAVVRFYHENGNDIEKLAVHTVTVNDRKVKVLCLRTPNDSETECPLCTEGYMCSPKMFLKLLVYTPDKNGYYTTPGVLNIWEKGRGFIKKIQSLINRYTGKGRAFYDTVFEIERCGKKGDNKTSYEIYPCENLEPDECPLPANNDGMEFSVVGKIVREYTFEDMEYFIENEEFPKKDDGRNKGGRSERVVQNTRERVSRNSEARNARYSRSANTEEEEEETLENETEYAVDEEEESVKPMPTGRRTAPVNNAAPAAPSRRNRI